MNFKTEYNLDPKQHRSTALVCKDKTLAQQQFRDECDINVLFGRYLETGVIPQVENGLSYGNFEGIFDFQTAMNAVRTAQGVFEQLPARIKNRFDNDPQKMLEFLADDTNREEAEFLGLVNKEKTDAPGPRENAPIQAQTEEGSQRTPEPAKAGETAKKP